MSGWRAAAVALVVGAVILAAGYIVPRLGSDTPETETTGGSDSEGLTLACVPAIERACEAAGEALDVPVVGWEPGGALPDRFVLIVPSGDVPQDRQPGPVIAESPIVIGAWLDRSQILVSHCGSLDVACLGSVLGERWEDIGGNDTWGDVKLGLADPSRTEAGLLAWSLVADAADEFRVGQSLRLTSSSDARLTADLVLFGDSRADLVVTSEVAVYSQLENAIGRGGRLEIFYPASSPWVEYVVVADGRGSGGLVEDLQRSDTSATLASWGLRPVGWTGTLPEGLGTPGDRGARPDSPRRATLIEAWERLG